MRLCCHLGGSRSLIVSDCFSSERTDKTKDVLIDVLPKYQFIMFLHCVNLLPSGPGFKIPKCITSHQMVFFYTTCMMFLGTRNNDVQNYYTKSFFILTHHPLDRNLSFFMILEALKAEITLIRYFYERLSFDKKFADYHIIQTFLKNSWFHLTKFVDWIHTQVFSTVIYRLQISTIWHSCVSSL